VFESNANKFPSFPRTRESSAYISARSVASFEFAALWAGGYELDSRFRGNDEGMEVVVARATANRIPDCQGNDEEGERNLYRLNRNRSNASRSCFSPRPPWLMIFAFALCRACLFSG
ncbi:MAG: hypothetical protein LBI87_15820, partial [Candidatus Accumulibacter sp.]|nr:hypothetical protein [Accumulibacter sp.]